MAFTTTTGSGGTSLIGTSGVDIANVTPSTLTSAVFIGAQGANDVVNLQTNQAINYTANLGSGNDTFTAAGLKGSVIKADDGLDTITLTGTTETSTVSGLNGDDTINVAGTIKAGALINGNSGSDFVTITAALEGGTVAGGADDDDILVNSATFNGGAKVNGQDGADNLTVVVGTDMSGATVFGGQGSDIISAAGSVNAVILSGDLGNDFLTGGADADTIFGGDGSDRITGGASGDSLIGGNGTDTFINANAAVGTVAGGATFSGATTITSVAASLDVVTDFVGGVGGDILDMAGTGFVQAYDALGAGNIINGGSFFISGTYSATTGIFTVAATNTLGPDTLVATFGVGVFANGDATVLKNVNSSTVTTANII